MELIYRKIIVCISLIRITILSLFFGHVATAIKFGPSITSEPSVVRLEDFPNFSVIVPLMENQVTAYAPQFMIEKDKWRESRMIIQAPEEFKIMMVIQQLRLGIGLNEKLQQDLEESGLTSCIDSIQVFEEKEQVLEVCGEANFTDKSTHPIGLVGDRLYVSKTNSITIELQFAKILTESSNFKWVWLNHRYQSNTLSRQFSLAIAFTAFKDCSEIQKFESLSYRSCSTKFQELPTNEDNVVKIGFNSKPLTGQQCIFSDLFCDGIMHCASVSSDFEISTMGQDEEGQICSGNSLNKVFDPFSSLNLQAKEKYHPVLKPVDMHNYHNQDIGIGPTSTILLIVLTVICVMILGVILRFCCAKCVGTPLPPNNSSLDSPRSSIWTISSTHGRPRSNRVQNSGEIYFPNFIVQSQCSRFAVEKDLPPRYEDLFPTTITTQTSTKIDIDSIDNSLPENNSEMQENNVIISSIDNEALTTRDETTLHNSDANQDETNLRQPKPSSVHNENS